MRNYLLLILFSIMSFVCFSQKTTKIDYSSAALNQRPQCNVFNISGSGLIGGVEHLPGAGGAMGTNKAVGLVSYETDNLKQYGTAYMIKYLFKKDATYTITINAYRSSKDPVAAPSLILSLQPTILDPNKTDPTGCGPTTEDHFSYFNTNQVGLFYINSGDEKFSRATTFTPTEDVNYLGLLSTFGSSFNIIDTVFIKSITIVEKSYPIFKLDNGTVNYSCGNTTPFTIQLTKNGGPTDNGSLQFKWNLGSNNGWKYNNSPAPSVITTTSPSLSLTPTGGQIPSNITISQFYNGLIVDSFKVNVKLNNIVHGIIGNHQLCSSQIYAVDSLFSGSSVQWTVTPVGIVSLNPSGNQVTVTKQSDGTAYLTAIVTNSCGIKDTTSAYKLVAGVQTPSFKPYGTVCNGESFRLSANPVEFATSRSWRAYTTNGNIALTETSPWAVEVNPGTLYVELTVTTACATTKKKQIIRYNNCGVSAFGLSPNPSSAKINIKPLIKNKKNNIQSYKIYDQSGRLIRSSTVTTQNSNAIDISALKLGVYYIELDTDSGIERHQFLKK